MSTRGLYGIRKNGIDKCTYNHCDSYPSGLGFDIVKFCANNSVENLKKFFDNIELVFEDSVPTESQIKECQKAGYVNFSVSSQSNDDWYCLLRNLQGNFAEYQKCIDKGSKVYMTDGIDFIKDSLFCEYAYIINLDDEVLEFYVGFQNTPYTNNRYGTSEIHGYYPCKLSLTIPLNELDDVERIVKMMEEEE